MSEKKVKIDVHGRIERNIRRDQLALERALVALDDRNIWRAENQARGKYLAGWIGQGKEKDKTRLTGRYIQEGLELVLRYIPELVPITLAKTREKIGELEKQLTAMRDWEKAIVEELSKLPFDQPPASQSAPTVQKTTQPSAEPEGKSIMQQCWEEGVY